MQAPCGTGLPEPGKEELGGVGYMSLLSKSGHHLAAPQLDTKPGASAATYSHLMHVDKASTHAANAGSVAVGPRDWLSPPQGGGDEEGSSPAEEGVGGAFGLGSEDTGSDADQGGGANQAGPLDGGFGDTPAADEEMQALMENEGEEWGKVRGEGIEVAA